MQVHINNLIQAYRSEFYDLSPAEIWSIIKSKRIILLITTLVFILIGALLIVSLCCERPFLMYGVIILEFVFCIVADRYIVKQYQGSLHNEAMHLEKVKTFLETVYPDHSLYCPVKIDILINLNDGENSSTAWGCDLTYDYVKINGDYRT